MLNAEQVSAVQCAILAIQALDHDCKKLPRGEHGCEVCDHLDTLIELNEQHKELICQTEQ